MNYRETLDYLFSSLPMYQRQGAAAYKENLDNTIALDEYLNKPHEKFKSIHIAGTNGKGSVSHMLAAVLSASGYRTGLYTSPHLLDFRERIRINGEMISEQEVVQFVEKHRDILEKLKPSFFEMSVAMAFEHFADRGVEIAVIETGMGGRLDSTNIISPVISIITNIGLDHTRFLGNTLPLIAREKAGIIKKHIPVVIGEWQKETAGVFGQVAAEKDSPLIYAGMNYRVERAMMNFSRERLLTIYRKNREAYNNLVTDLLGSYQDKNIPTVLQSLEVLKEQGFNIPEKAVFEGFSKVKDLTGLRGRWEELDHNPLTIADTAHNLSGVKAVTDQLQSTPRKKLHMVWGMVSDKDAGPILELLPKDAEYYFCNAQIPRALDARQLALKAQEYGLAGEPYPDVKTAFQSAMKNADKEDLVFIGGSTFVVAEVLEFYSPNV